MRIDAAEDVFLNKKERQNRIDPADGLTYLCKWSSPFFLLRLTGACDGESRANTLSLILALHEAKQPDSEAATSREEA